MLSNKAFTLVELAIVIIIIGLLVAAVLTGQELIEQSKVKKTVNQIESYKSFRFMYIDKYKAVPGDHSKAFDFFGTNCDSTAALCNGDGNGKTDTYQESYKFWKHLSLAKIYPNSLTGSAPVGGGYFLAGENTPAGVFDGSGFTLPGNPSSTSHYNTNTDYNFIEFGNRRAGCFAMYDSNYRCGVVAPEAARQIDEKLDNSDPFSGKVLVLRGREYDSDDTACVTGPYTSTTKVDFISSDQRKSCRILFIYE